MKSQQMGIMLTINSILFSIMSFYFKSNKEINNKMNFLDLNSAQFNLEMTIDWKLLSFIAVVSFIAGNIFIYSKSYMLSDQFAPRFTIILLLFTLSMIWTIMFSKNMLSILIGWDFLGLSSFLLIIHYQSVYVFNFGMTTFLLNRIGDIAFIITGAIMFSSGSWSILSFNINDYINYIILLLSLAAFTKSAQMPFSSWLPKAMAAPTPVSALVHSSTLVTAGVFLLIRINPVELSNSASKIMLTISVITMFIGSTAAMIDYDLKKIIAFSTLSQISFMMIILLMGEGNMAFYHLITHAIFKSLMFMAAGTIIHHCLGEQDIRSINMMSKWLPLETMMINLSFFALAGFPFLSGFYSKDSIIEFYMNSNNNMIMSLMIDLSICMTAMYASRLSAYLCWNNSLKNIIMNYASSKQEKFIMIVFSMPIILSGSLLSWMFMKNYTFEVPLPTFMKSFGVWGGIMTFSLTMIMMKFSMATKYFMSMISSIMFLDNLFEMINKTFFILCKMINNFIENLWIKYLSINFLFNMKKINMHNTMFSPTSLFKSSIMMMSLMILYMMIK